MSLRDAAAEIRRPAKARRSLAARIVPSPIQDYLIAAWY